MALRSLLFRNGRRAFHTARLTKGSGGPAWGTEVNEPGGRLFGEAILKPGERRKMFDWEVPFYATYVTAGIMLGVGLNSRPECKVFEQVEIEAQRRIDALGLDEDDNQAAE